MEILTPRVAVGDDTAVSFGRRDWYRDRGGRLYRARGRGRTGQEQAQVPRDPEPLPTQLLFQRCATRALPALAGALVVASPMGAILAHPEEDRPERIRLLLLYSHQKGRVLPAQRQRRRAPGSMLRHPRARGDGAARS